MKALFTWIALGLSVAGMAEDRTTYLPGAKQPASAQRGGSRPAAEDYKTGAIPINVDKGSLAELPKPPADRTNAAAMKTFNDALKSKAEKIAYLAQRGSNGVIKSPDVTNVEPTYNDKGEIDSLRIEGAGWSIEGVARLDIRVGADPKLMFFAKVSPR